MTTKYDPTIAPTLPHSPKHERAVLAAILSGHKSARSVLGRLAESDFYVSQNRHVFVALKTLDEANKPTDELNVLEALSQTGQLDAAGGIAYLEELTRNFEESAQLEYYVATLKDKSVRRAVAYKAHATFEHAVSGTDTAEKVLDLAIEQFSMIARDLEADRDSGIPYRDAAARLLMEFDSKEGVRIFTDIDELDRLTGGYRAGEVILLTADTGVGKTFLAQQTRRRSCRDGRHTLFCSGEMMAHHLIARELATEANVEHWKMRRPERITREEMSALVKATSHECQQCRILDGELSMARIRRVARQMKSSTGLDLVIVDYDELVEAPGKDEFEQQRYIVRATKSLAMELGCPAIVISQLRKSLQGEDRKKPTLQRLYGSAAKAKHSSIVVYVDRPYVQELSGDETEARIVVLKNRDGKIGGIEARFNIHTLRFESVQATDQTPAKSSRRDGKAAASGSGD